MHAQQATPSNDRKPLTSKAFYVGTHRYGFLAGKPAEIIGVWICTPTDRPPRPCFHLKFEDGHEDFVPIENQPYEIISEEQLRAGQIPDLDQ